MIGKCSRFAVVIFIVIMSGCGAQSLRVENVNLRFAILGNTAPESPFSGWNDDLPAVIKSIKSENPDIVIHLGNMIFGGSSQSGVRRIDGERQFSLFKADMSEITALVYTLPGDADLLDGSSMLYEISTGHRSNYSFNVSGIHCLMLNNAARNDNLPDPEAMLFMKNDIGENADFSSVLIFIHRPPLDRKGNARDPKLIEEFFNILAGVPVLAVVSSGESGYYEINRRGVRFISLPCEAYNPYLANNYQYYILKLSNGTLAIEGRRVERTRRGDQWPVR